LPARIMTNDELSKTVDTTDEWIQQRVGIKQRHIAADDEVTSDLAVHAARRALDAAHLSPDDIDLIVVATTTPDLTFPATAAIVQQKLGMHHGAAFDIQAVCSGFVYGLATADSYLKNGLARRALVIGAETTSRIRPHDLRVVRRRRRRGGDRARRRWRARRAGLGPAFGRAFCRQAQHDRRAVLDALAGQDPHGRP
jgi:3-oxoacyl-(acyl-carrier-protein) synthase III